MPRGLPKDVTDEVKTERRGWGSDGHSASWHSLRHLLEYPHWQNKRTYREWESDRQETVDVEYTYHDLCRELTQRTIPGLLLLCSTDERVKAWAEEAMAGDKSTLIPLHDWLEEHGRPGLDDVRMVFWFDN